MAKITTKPADVENETADTTSETVAVAIPDVESPQAGVVKRGRKPNPNKPPEFVWNDDLDEMLAKAAYDIVHGNRAGGLTAGALTNAIAETATNSVEDPSTLVLLTDKAVAKRYGQIVRGLAKQGIELPGIEKPSKRHKMDTARLAAIWQGQQANS